MPVIVVTRLRLRDPVLLTEFFTAGAAVLRELWIRSFESIGRLVYRSARPIVSLYEGNRARQHDE